jgi:diguanylate cyclase (GGDEF)-like protein
MLYFLVRTQVGEAFEASERIHHLAYFDGLTELPNRALLTDRLSQTIAQSLREQVQSALILFNVDRFKKINDVRGQCSGDHLLKALIQRLEAVVQDGDTFARVGGNEFAILLDSLNSNPQSASHTAMIATNKIQHVLNHPFIIDEDEIRVTVSMGLTLFPDGDSDSADEVIKRADNALHKAKNKGGNQSLFFESEMGRAAEQYFQIERELRKGIDEGELRLYLQSQVDATGRVVGAEALVRWLHPEQGLVSPLMFIPVSELTALGIHFSIDDFGTGYSSLSYLKRLPIHELKIDKMFVQDAPVDAGDAALVETILAVAKHLRLGVVAEGVETREQAAVLNERAVVIHQGYLYSKPEPASSWIENQLPHE